MKLNEKKCPNCGATLEFSETDKSCTCSYCGRGFEIERENDKYKLIYDTINDSKEVIKNTLMISTTIKCIIVIAFVIIFAVTIIMITRNANNNNKHINRTNTSIIEDKTDNKEKLISDVNSLTNQDFETIETKNRSIVNQSVVGGTDSKHAYYKTGDPRLVKTVVAYKEDSNYLISIYEVNYYNFFNEKEKYKVYVPVVFNTVTTNIYYSLANGKNPAPKYFFNKQKTNYIYAYKNYNAAYDGIVKPLENDYKITQK